MFLRSPLNNHEVLDKVLLFRLSCWSDKLLKAGKLAEIKVGGGAATLTLPHLAKDDEGLYTLRMWTKDGTTEHSAYLFVKGKVIWSYNN